MQRGEFPPPRQLDPSIDRALEAVCLKAMATEAGGPLRAPAAALAEDIERWMADEPVSAWREPSDAGTDALAGAAPHRGDGGRRGGAGGPGRHGCRAGRADAGSTAT